jgi:hypothetical protein
MAFARPQPAILLLDFFAETERDICAIDVWPALPVSARNGALKSTHQNQVVF